MGARLTTRHRGINKLQVQRFGQPLELASHTGRGGGVVNKDRARCHASKSALLSQGHAAQVVVIADAAENQGSSLGRLARCWRLINAACAGEFSAPCG